MGLGSLLGLLQEEYPEAHQFRRQIWLMWRMNGARGSIFTGEVRNSKGQHAKKELNESRLTQSVKLREKAEGKGARMNKCV